MENNPSPFFAHRSRSRGRVPGSVLIAAIFLFSFLGCSQGNYVTVKHVKPVNRNRYYNPKKDKRKKRVKYTKMKILKRSPKTASAPVRKKKKKVDPPQKQDTVKYESDTTGFLP